MTSFLSENVVDLAVGVALQQVVDVAQHLNKQQQIQLGIKCIKSTASHIYKASQSYNIIVHMTFYTLKFMQHVYVTY